MIIAVIKMNVVNFLQILLIHMSKKQVSGTCHKLKIFYGSIKVTDKGQIAIPIDIRRELDIEAGNKLFVIKRKDGKGINLIKEDELEKFLNNLANN